MPGLSGTGPQGLGAGTGRGLGPCGCGSRRGWNLGQGFGRRFLSRKEEVEALKDQKIALEADLKALNEELKGLEK